MVVVYYPKSTYQYIFHMSIGVYCMYVLFEQSIHPLYAIHQEC